MTSRIDVFHIVAGSDEAWEDAETGWYWGEVDDEYGYAIGDSVGPFDTESDARADMTASRSTEVGT